MPETRKTTDKSVVKISKLKTMIFGKHRLKSLNLSLLFYLCFGVFMFDYLDEFKTTTTTTYNITSLSEKQQQQDLKQNDKTSLMTNNNNDSPRNKLISLSDLRLSSVHRMWNITNQLNILYESNWTSLVLEELIKYEQELINSIQINPLSNGDDSITSDSLLDSLNDIEIKSNKNKLEEFKHRIKSIKKSLIHSIATITTIGKLMSYMNLEHGDINQFCISLFVCFQN